MQPVVIIGTGHAGYTAAREFRKHDTTTPLVMATADDGTSYTKPMLSNAMARGKTPAQLAQASAEDMGEQLGARIITHSRVTSIDAANRRLHFNDGGELDAAKIVLGIGANQIDPHLPGDGADDVWAVNDLDSYRRAREALEHGRRVVLIGGGLIGCEFANDWANAGYEVTIIEALDYPMGRALPPRAGEALRAALSGTGVNVVTGRRVTAVEREGGTVVVDDDSGERHPADVAVRALGLRPRTRLAEEAGIAIGHGIRADRKLETSAAGIYALGDCAEVDGLVLPFVMPISNAARALGPTLAGTDTEVNYPVMPVIVKTPSCPVQFYAPPAGVEGEWHEEETDSGGIRGLFHDREGRPRGFVLTGPAVALKAEMVKQVPGWFDNRY